MLVDLVLFPFSSSHSASTYILKLFLNVFRRLLKHFMLTMILRLQIVTQFCDGALGILNCLDFLRSINIKHWMCDSDHFPFASVEFEIEKSMHLCF